MQKNRQLGPVAHLGNAESGLVLVLARVPLQGRIIPGAPRAVAQDLVQLLQNAVGGTTALSDCAVVLLSFEGVNGQVLAKAGNTQNLRRLLFVAEIAGELEGGAYLPILSPAEAEARAEALQTSPRPSIDYLQPQMSGISR